MPPVPAVASRRPTTAVLLSLCLALLSPTAFGQANIEVHGGMSATTGGETTSVVAAAWTPELRKTDHGSLRLELGAMRFDGRDVPGRDLSDNVGVGYVGLRFERDNGFLYGFGVGAQSGHSDALSGDPQFVSSLGWRWSRFSLIGRHVSNASLHEPNNGETMLLAGWRF